jgi:hypothetical protein
MIYELTDTLTSPAGEVTATINRHYNPSHEFDHGSFFTLTLFGADGKPLSDDGHLYRTREDALRLWAGISRWF